MAVISGFGGAVVYESGMTGAGLNVREWTATFETDNSVAEPTFGQRYRSHECAQGRIRGTLVGVADNTTEPIDVGTVNWALFAGVIILIANDYADGATVTEDRFEIPAVVTSVDISRPQVGPAEVTLSFSNSDAWNVTNNLSQGFPTGAYPAH